MLDSLSSDKAKISLVVPVLNEAQAIPVFYAAVTQFMPLQGVTLELIFVDDGSTDATPDILRDLKAKDCRVIPLSFTRHFGKEAALMAGFAHSTGDAVVPIDVDLQDPIEVIPQLIEEWQNGSEIVLAKRSDRTSDGWLKRNTALVFYRLHNAISSPKIEENVGDFRLLSRSVVDNVLKLDERNLFMKGILSWPGGKTSIVEYVRKPRTVGKSRFNGRKLWHLALDGITSFSTVPLRIWTYLGSLIALVSFAYGVFLILKKLLFEIDVSGYASIMVSILFLGGIQLIGIGVVGEYVGRVYQEVKHRPRYVLKKDDSDEA